MTRNDVTTQTLLKRIRITLVCNECGHKWCVSPNASDPQCAKCNSVDFEVK